MRVYITVDFEGAAAVVGQAGVPLGAEARQYDFARRMVTAEANAAIEGALAAGATDTIVGDAHGSGLNLAYDELHPRVRIVIGTPRPRRFAPLDSSFTGVFMVGYHAMAGTTNGILAHSYSSVSIQHMWLNGRRIGEIGVDAAQAGSLGVPVLLVTSDAAGCEEARQFLGGSVRTVATKEGLGRNAALSLHPLRARELIREAAEDALRHADGVPPFLVVQPPYRLRREYKLESSADDVMAGGPLTTSRIDSRTVETVADDLFLLV